MSLGENYAILEEKNTFMRDQRLVGCKISKTKAKQLLETQYLSTFTNISQSSTLYDITEETDENSELDDSSLSNIDDLHLLDHKDLLTEGNIQSTDVNLDFDSSSINEKTQEFSYDKYNYIPMMDREFTEVLLIQLQRLKKAIIEVKAEKKSLLEKSEEDKKETEKIIQQNNFLSVKIANFEKQEVAMVKDRQELTSELVFSREKVRQLEQLHAEDFGDVSSIDLQKEISELSNTLVVLTRKLESCEKTLQTVTDENNALKEQLKLSNGEKVKADGENGRLSNELTVCKQRISNKVKQKDTILTISKKQRENTNYEEVQSFTPSSPQEEVPIVENGNLPIMTEKRSVYTPTMSQIQSQNQNIETQIKALQNYQKINEKATLDRLSTLDGKFPDVIALVEDIRKRQEKLATELELKFNQNIENVTNQISSLKGICHTLVKQMQTTPTGVAGTSNPLKRDVSANGGPNKNLKKLPSKSSIPVLVKKRNLTQD